METEVWLLGPLTNDEPVQERWNLPSPILPYGFGDCYNSLDEMRIAAETPQTQALAHAFLIDWGFVEQDQPTDKQTFYRRGDHCYIGPWQGDTVTCYLMPLAVPGHGVPEPNQPPLPIHPQDPPKQADVSEIPEALRRRFNASWQAIYEAVQNETTLYAQQWQVILDWIKALGSHEQFRFGNSMQVVILSRARTYGLRPDQDSLAIHIYRDGAVDLIYTGSIKKKDLHGTGKPVRRPRGTADDPSATTHQLTTNHGRAAEQSQGRSIHVARGGLDKNEIAKRITPNEVTSFQPTNGSHSSTPP